MNLKNLFSPKPGASVPSAAAQPMCAAGHALDPHWGGVCPYCEAIKRGRDKSTAATTAATTAVDLDATVIERTTRIGVAPAPLPAASLATIPPIPPASGRETRIAPVPAPFQAAGAASTDPRRITALLVSFSGRSTGRVCPIREGRNTIGRGSPREGRRCDVEVTDDPHVAVEHALVLSRAGRHELLDLGSGAATLLDNASIGSQVVELSDHGMIRVGATVFEFLRIAGWTDTGEAAAPPDDGPQPYRSIHDDRDPDRTGIG